MKIRHTPLIAFAILLYAAWNASELLVAWSKPHIEKYSWIVFLIWIIPIPLYWTIRRWKTSQDSPFHSMLLWAALLMSFLGVIGSINAVKYLGFTFALAAFLPLQWSLIPWIFSALSWMPAFGWLGLHYFPNYLLGVRVFLAIFGVSFWIFSKYYTTVHSDL